MVAPGAGPSSVRGSAFALIELLVVISIIALLVSLAELSITGPNASIFNHHRSGYEGLNAVFVDGHGQWRRADVTQPRPAPCGAYTSYYPYWY